MTTDLVDAAQRSFRSAASCLKGFQKRAGQELLVRAIAETLAGCEYAEDSKPQPHVLVAEAGTGTGKTIAYVLSSLPIARAKGVKLVISTATVSLMEQLQNKDLPALSAVVPGGFTFGLAKGRGRYLCPQKLESRLENSTQGSLSLDENDLAQPMPDADAAQPIAVFRKLADAFERKVWNGERDSLPEEVSPAEWTGVAADRISCTGRSCPRFMDCPFYANKRKLVKVDVIVTNHDLLLSTLVHGGGAVPTPEKAIYVLDEAHHLPSVALGQSEISADLSSPPWVNALERACRLAANAGLVQSRVDPNLPGHVAECMRHLERMCRDFLSVDGKTLSERMRFEHGQVHQPLDDLAMNLMHACATWSMGCHILLDEVKEARAGAGESGAKRVDAIFIELAENAAKLDETLEVLRMFVNEAHARAAKWLSVRTARRQQIIRLNVCPLTAAPTLRRYLWSRVRGAVLTSATIRTLGSFDYFLRESGLRQMNPRTENVESPFDYEKQGTIIVSRTPASPQGANQERFVQAMTPRLLQDLAAVPHGALALFSSKRLMEQVAATLPPDLKRRVLIQGSKPRDELLKKHRDRVNRGKASILFGMASFGEGIDLPGKECEFVFVPKLPFPMPTSPIEEARAEWVKSHGGRPFLALTVPATGILMTQWVGRGIRTEFDRATIVFYDPRLVEKPYGKQLLAGLPAFTRKLRTHEGVLQKLQ